MKRYLIRHPSLLIFIAALILAGATLFAPNTLMTVFLIAILVSGIYQQLQDNKHTEQTRRAIKETLERITMIQARRIQQLETELRQEREHHAREDH